MYGPPRKAKQGIAQPFGATQRLGASGVHRGELFTGDGYIHGSQTCRLSGVIRCGPEGVCSDPCRQLVGP